MDILDLWPLALVVTQICIYFVVGLLLIFLNEIQRSEHGELKEVEDYSAKVTENPTVLRRETWEAWAGALHPGWLLGVRIIAFVYLSALLIKVCSTRQSLFSVYYFYTEWTLTLLIIYFGWGTCLSIFEYQHNVHVLETLPDVETPELQQSMLFEDEVGIAGSTYLDPYSSELLHAKAGYSGYILQILFQTVAPAVVLTDGVYWTLLYPFFPVDFPHTFLDLNLHAVNAVFLTAELCLNSMRFPWFRAAYFFIWSCLYVFFQWSIHASGYVDLPWPYPFLEVATTDAPFWYFAIGILHISAYATISFLNRLKLVLQDRDSILSTRARCWSIARSLCPGG